MTARQLFDGDAEHDWMIPRLDGAQIVADGGAFVVVAPGDPAMRPNARVVVERYGIRGSTNTNTTDTDPFTWKLCVRGLVCVW